MSLERHRESLAPIYAMSSSNLFHDLFSSDELTSQDYLNVPTPGVFHGTDSESSFPRYGATPNTDRYESPGASTPYLPSRTPEKLALLQLSEWDQTKTYDDDPPSCLRVTIRWKVTLNGKPITEDTEEDVALTLPCFWEMTIQPKVEESVAPLQRRKKNMKLISTKVTVSVEQRLQRDLVKQYRGADIFWAEVEIKLVQWGEFFRKGKALRVDLVLYYDDRDEAGQQSTTSSKKVDKRSARSATQQMLTENGIDLETEREATGQAPIWPAVYNLFRCPLLSCDSDHCWIDPIGKTHHPLNTPLLRDLVKYRQAKNVLETHSDVPEYLQEKIRLEDQQRRDRKRKARAASPQAFHPVNITNVIPGHAELPSLQASQTGSRSSISPPKPVSALDIPGYRDDAVQDYVEYLKGKVRNKKHRDEFEKAGKIVLDELLDLDQVYQENKPEFFTAREVKLAAAAQFIRDIPAFVRHKQGNDS